MSWRMYLLAIGVALIVVGVLSTLSLAVAGFAEAHMSEDSTVEMAGALIFLLAALLSAIAVSRGAGALAVLTGLFGLVAFLDELSFGERYFGFEAPMVNGVKMDAVHDLLTLSYRTVGNARLYLVLFIVFGILVVLASVKLIRRSSAVRSMISNRAAPLVAAAVTLVAAAQFIDYSFGKIVLSQIIGESGFAVLRQAMAEEAAEFMAAVLLSLAALVLLFAPQSKGDDIPPISV